VLGLGAALGLLPRVRLPRWSVVPLTAVGLLALWTALSLLWTESDERTVTELARVVGLGGIALLVLSLVDSRTWRAAAAGLGLAAVLVCAVALASRLAPHAFPADEVKRAFGRRRLNYPFYYWNAVAAWGAMSLAMALAWSAEARRLAVRLAFSAAIPACALTVYLSYSRAGVAGSALAVIAVLAFTHNRWVAAVHALAGAGAAAIVILVTRDHDAIAKATGTAGAGAVAAALLLGAAICVAAVALTWVARGDVRWRVPRPLGRVGVAAAVVTVALLTVTAGRAPISKGWDQFQKSEEDRTSQSADPAARLTSLSGNRSHLWKSAVRGFKSDPVKGVGAGAYEFWWNRDDGEEFVRDAHSLYLESLAELGVPGLVLLLTFLLGLLALALRARWSLPERRTPGALAAPAAALTVFLLHAGVDWMWESTAVAVLAIMSGSVAAAALAHRRSGPALAARIGLPILAVVAIAVQVPGLASTSAVRDSQSFARKGQLSDALASANDAVDAQPWASTPFVQRGLVERSTGRLGAAAVDLRRAVRREPTNWRPRLLVALVEAERGRTRAAVRAYRQARRLRPKSPFFAPRSIPGS